MAYLVGRFFKIKNQCDDGGWIQGLVAIFLIFVIKGKTKVFSPTMPQ